MYEYMNELSLVWFGAGGDWNQLCGGRTRGGGTVQGDHVYPVPHPRHIKPHRRQRPLGTG